MSNTVIFIIFVIFIIMLFTYKWYSSPLRHVTEYKVDNDTNVYYIQEKYQDKDKAAKMMSIINNRVLKVLKYMKKKLESGEYESERARGIVSRMLKNWNPEMLYESPPSAEGTSYTIGKGQKTVFCLRNKHNESLHEMDDMLYVVLHELSHMGDLNWGHKESFWETFKFVLQEAKESNIYEPINYQLEPIKYCGLDVNYNPYFDEKIKPV